MAKRAFFSVVLLIFIGSIVLSSCTTFAGATTAFWVYDRTKTQKTKKQLYDDYMDARWALVKIKLDSWVGCSEKDLISAFGIPAYTQSFDNDKLVFYEKAKQTSVTTGGKSYTEHGTYFSTTRKEDEVTTFSEQKGTVKINIHDGMITACDYDGYLKQIEEIIKTTSEQRENDTYKTAAANVDASYKKWNTRSDTEWWLPYAWGAAIVEWVAVWYYFDVIKD